MGFVGDLREGLVIDHFLNVTFLIKTGYKVVKVKIEQRFKSR